jgi:hypothetical protein
MEEPLEDWNWWYGAGKNQEYFHDAWNTPSFT